MWYWKDGYCVLFCLRLMFSVSTDCSNWICWIHKWQIICHCAGCIYRHVTPFCDLCTERHFCHQQCCTCYTCADNRPLLYIWPELHPSLFHLPNQTSAGWATIYNALGIGTITAKYLLTLFWNMQPRVVPAALWALSLFHYLSVCLSACVCVSLSLCQHVCVSLSRTHTHTHTHAHTHTHTHTHHFCHTLSLAGCLPCCW